MYTNPMVTVNKKKSTIENSKSRRNPNTTLNLDTKSKGKRAKEEGEEKTYRNSFVFVV